MDIKARHMKEKNDLEEEINKTRLKYKNMENELQSKL